MPLRKAVPAVIYLAAGEEKARGLQKIGNWDLYESGSDNNPPTVI